MKRGNQFVFILGPHRSGTSLVAGSLHALGVSLGSRFIAPNQDNPKGFFEDEEIVRFNDRLLRSMNLSWDSFGFIWEQDFTAAKLRPYHNAAVALVLERFKDTRLAGLKDPRLCILLPFWKRVISQALDVEISYVLCVREPEHCVSSQKARHIKDSDFHLLGKRNIHTLLLWLTYLRKALAEVDPARLMVVNYASMVEAPEMQLHRLAGFLELQPSPQEIECICRDQVDPLLNRNTQQGAVKRSKYPLLWGVADTLYERLLAMSKGDSIHRDAVTGTLEALDIQELEPICLKELQFMNGYSYKKIVSLRHRLIQTVDEISEGRGKLEQLWEKYHALHDDNELLHDHHKLLIEDHHLLHDHHKSLIEDHQLLHDHHKSLIEDHQLLHDHHKSLIEDYERLLSAHQAVLNTKGWRLLTALRRFIPRRFG